LPEGQAEQNARPVSAAIVPLAQSAHSLSVAVAAILPLAHVVQVAVPGAGEKLPSPHSTQLDDTAKEK
jgi:hypothetical protein